MKLGEWLDKHSLTNQAFADILQKDGGGTVSRATVMRWRSGEVMPDAENLRRIYRVTYNSVTANDFFGTHPTSLPALQRGQQQE